MPRCCGRCTRLRSATSLVLARGVDQGGRVKPVFVPFLAVAGHDGAGLATWPIDPDATVRRFDERQGEGAAAVPTLSGVMARRLKAATAPGLIDFALGPPFGYTPAHEVAAWAVAGDEAKLRATFGNRVVLVGSVLPFKDRHNIPVGLAAWEDSSTAPGVLIHAQALRSLLGPGLDRPRACGGRARDRARGGVPLVRVRATERRSAALALFAACGTRRCRPGCSHAACSCRSRARSSSRRSRRPRASATKPGSTAAAASSCAGRSPVRSAPTCSISSCAASSTRRWAAGGGRCA